MKVDILKKLLHNWYWYLVKVKKLYLKKSANIVLLGTKLVTDLTMAKCDSDKVKW